MPASEIMSLMACSHEGLDVEAFYFHITDWSVTNNLTFSSVGSQAPSSLLTCSLPLPQVMNFRQETNEENIMRGAY